MEPPKQRNENMISKNDIKNGPTSDNDAEKMDSVLRKMLNTLPEKEQKEVAKKETGKK